MTITTQNNIRYQIDQLNPLSYGVLVSKHYVNFVPFTQVKKIILDYFQPEGTQIFIAFGIGSAWYKLDSSGRPQLISSATPNFNILATSGNTPEELIKINNLEAFKKTQIRIAVGLSSYSPREYIPRIKISFSVLSSTQTLTFSELSPVFELPVSAKISSADLASTLTGTGKVNLTAKITKPDGSESDFMELAGLTGLSATSVQFRANYSVDNINSGSARVDNVNLVYSAGQNITSGVTSGEIISITQNWYMDISQSRMTVKHAPLENAKIDAYIALRKQPENITNETLGRGNGGKKTFKLTHTQGLKYDSFKLYYDGQRTFSDFEFNTQIGQITCEAPDGALIACDYQYNWEKEIWEQMTLSKRYALDDYDVSEFRFAENIKSENSKSICAVKIVLTMTEGSIDSEYVGLGTGKIQVYQLKHRVKNGDIHLYVNGGVLNPKNYYVDDDPQYIHVAAQSGMMISAKYSWISETPKIYEFAAVFSE